MECKKVSAARKQLLDPLGEQWRTITAEPVTMTATPLANQPSEYIKARFDEKKIGRVKALAVQAVHNGTDIFFRLTWSDESDNAEITDNNIFPDGCGILMPLHDGEPVIEEMGGDKVPVNAWFWRADFGEEARNTVAQGLGTTMFTEHTPIEARGVWKNGTWSVVFARALAIPEQADETVQLEAGKAIKIGFAVWEGSSGERAGVKSFSKEWRELALEQ